MTSPPIEIVPHPSEHSRLLLALSATAIVFGGFGIVVVGSGGWAALGGLAVFLLVVAFVVWIALQIYRARLLGSCVRVTRESVPELHAVVEEVRARLDYHRRVDICVVQKANPPAQLTSYLGTKVIVLEGGLVADLVHGPDRAQVTFLVARYIGALKARHERLTIVFVLLEAVSSLKFLFPFVLPYYRATTYSGDQIGQLCCGELDGALAATERLLVGRELEPEVRARGVIQQAGLVRRRVLPRLAQLFQFEPHLTNRYLNLLFCARRSQPEAWEAFCGSADPDTTREVAGLWQRSPHKRPAPARARRLAASTVVAVLTCAILVGIALVTLPSAQDEPAYASTYDLPPAPEATVAPEPTPEETAPARGSDVAELKGHVPIAFRDSCRRDAAGAAVTAVDCTPPGEDTPGFVRYYQFADQTIMDAEFDAYAADLTARDCPDGESTWTSAESSGRVACYTDEIGSNSIVWTDDSLQILGQAESILIGPRRLHRWWVAGSGPV